MEMPRVINSVKITNQNGVVIEIPEISVEQLKELVGANGHGSNGTTGRQATFAPDFEGLKKSLSENARKFLRVLRENPAGISADHLAAKLGFTSGTQIGGMTGGGIRKNADKYHVELTDVYKLEVSQQHGQRLTTYKPGKEIAKLQ
jgi:hypothetical protein